MEIMDVSGKNYTFCINDLYGDIIPEKSSVKVRILVSTHLDYMNRMCSVAITIIATLIWSKYSICVCIVQGRSHRFGWSGNNRTTFLNIKRSLPKI